MQACKHRVIGNSWTVGGKKSVQVLTFCLNWLGATKGALFFSWGASAWAQVTRASDAAVSSLGFFCFLSCFNFVALLVATFTLITTTRVRYRGRASRACRVQRPSAASSCLFSPRHAPSENRSDPSGKIFPHKQNQPL